MSDTFVKLESDEMMFQDSTVSGGFAQLPVEANYLRWKRGNADLEKLIVTQPAIYTPDTLVKLFQGDPGAYVGGWSALIEAYKEPHNPLPFVPFPIVPRASQDGSVTFKRYASNVVDLQLICARMRYELWDNEHVNKDGTKGKLLAISPERIQGYKPLRQIFGLALAEDGTGYPVVLRIDTWSASISYEKATQAWAKVKAPAGQVVVRSFGTLGEMKNGNLVPKFEVFGEGKSTPIEAVGIAKPRFVTVTDEVRQLWRDAQDWVKCLLWNADAEFEETEESNEFTDDETRARDLAIELKMTNGEFEQILKEQGGDYSKTFKFIEDNKVALQNE